MTNGLTGIGSSFCGIQMNQSWVDLWLWENFLNQVKPNAIIELGTGNGGMSLYLATQARERNAQFRTVDCTETRLAEIVRPHFVQANIFESETIQELINTLPKPLLLFCDDGNKPREYKTFVPLLRAGDFVVVHDWGTEFFGRDADKTLTREMVAEPCETHESHTRFYMRVWSKEPLTTDG